MNKETKLSRDLVQDLDYLCAVAYVSEEILKTDREKLH